MSKARCRQFLFVVILFSAAALCWAQSPTRIARVVMVSDFVNGSPPPEIVKAFRDELRELGWVEGRGFLFEQRHAGSVQQRREIAAELSRNPPDAVNLCPPCAIWARPSGMAPIRGVPMVFIFSDPVAAGLVKSLARPGGSMTGVATLGIELDFKRIELLKETMPKLARLAILVASNHPLHDRIVAQMTDAAARMNVKPRYVEVASTDPAEKIDAAFEAIAREGAEAVLGLQNPLFHRERARITALALKYRLPGLFDGGDSVEAGAFMTYEPDWAYILRRIASYLDKILRGAKPADLPVEQADRFRLSVNLRTAKALGITVPRSVLLRADQVVE